MPSVSTADTFSARKNFSNSRGRALGHADAGVGDRAADLGAVVGDRDLDAAAVRRVLDRVRDQVLEHLAQQLGVAHDRVLGVEPGRRELVIALANHRLDVGEHVLHQLREVAARRGPGRAAALEPGHAEQVVDEHDQPLRGVQAVGDEAAHVGRAVVLAHRELEHPLDAGERRAQLVAGEVDEVGLHLHRRLELLAGAAPLGDVDGHAADAARAEVVEHRPGLIADRQHAAVVGHQVVVAAGDRGARRQLTAILLHRRAIGGQHVRQPDVAVDEAVDVAAEQLRRLPGSRSGGATDRARLPRR